MCLLGCKGVIVMDLKLLKRSDKRRPQVVGNIMAEGHLHALAVEDDDAAALGCHVIIPPRSPCLSTSTMASWTRSCPSHTATRSPNGTQVQTSANSPGTATCR